MLAAGTTAVNVVGFFMALLSFRGFDASSLPAQGEQRLPLIFNIQRGNAISAGDFFSMMQLSTDLIAAISRAPGSTPGEAESYHFRSVQH